MPRTLGYHFVRSAYGLWLPGDDRGHWSEAWDDLIGYTETHTLHHGDPVRLRMAEERMKHPPVRWSAEMQSAITGAIESCAANSDWKVAAYAIDETHFHLGITYTTRDIDGTAKWLGQMMTKAVHRLTPHAGPVFCKGNWLQFVFEGGALVEHHRVHRTAQRSEWTIGEAVFLHPIKPRMVSAPARLHRPPADGRRYHRRLYWPADSIGGFLYR